MLIRLVFHDVFDGGGELILEHVDAEHALEDLLDDGLSRHWSID